MNNFILKNTGLNLIIIIIKALQFILTLMSFLLNNTAEFFILKYSTKQNIDYSKISQSTKHYLQPSYQIILFIFDVKKE